MANEEKHTVTGTIWATARYKANFGKVDEPVTDGDEQGMEIEIDPFAVDGHKLSRVSYGYGLTLSLGEDTYEFARVDVKVSLPAYVEELDEALACAENMAKKHVEEQYKKVQKFARERNR